MKDLDTIVDKYKNMVYRIALVRVGNHWDADDVFQEVFITYYQKAPDFQEEEHLKAWLINTTINISKKVTGSLWRKRMHMVSDTENRSEESYEFELPEENEIFIALSKLPAKYRIVLFLFYFEELSTKEIAKATSTKEGTVRMRLTRARTIMKDYLGKEAF